MSWKRNKGGSSNLSSPLWPLTPPSPPSAFSAGQLEGSFTSQSKPLPGSTPPTTRHRRATDGAPSHSDCESKPSGAHVTCFLSRGLRPPSSPCAAGGGTGPSSPQGDRTVGRGCVAHLTGLRGHAGLDFLHFPFPPPTGMACKPQGRMDPEEQSCLFFLFFFFK